MPLTPPNKLLELALSRRKLFEKIVQHVASRKIQNHIQATGDRMNVTPQQFGMQLGKQTGKQAFVTLPATAGIGAGVGALTSPSGHRMEGAGRGAAIGAGTGVGMGIGGAAGAIGAAALGLLNPRAGKALFGPNKAQLVEAMKRFIARGGRTMMRSGKKVPIHGSGRMSPYTDAMLRNATTRGGVAGLVAGGLGGGALSESALGAPSWEKKEAATGVKQALGAIDHLGLDGGLIGRATNNFMRGHADYHINSMLQHSNNADRQTGAAMSAGFQDAVTNPLSGGMMGSLLNGKAKNPAMQAMQSRANARQSFLNAGKNLLTPVTSGPFIAQSNKMLAQQPKLGPSAGNLNRVYYGAPKQASALSVLGGLAGGGLGGLAGGAGGGILGALGGGALGGGPGAGLGLLAGGAAGLGAGAHMGGNIGASIGAGFSKKKEKPKSDEKEEKSEEKSEESGDEEVKESAARVLAQLQKNAK